MSSPDFDITKNIRTIEMLKSQLLSGVSDLHADLLNVSIDRDERSEILADILIVTYLLANRLGVSHKSLDAKAIHKLKLGMLEDNDALHDDLTALFKHINKQHTML